MLTATREAGKSHFLDGDTIKIVGDLLSTRATGEQGEGAWKIRVILVAGFGMTRHADGIPEIMKYLVYAPIKLRLVG